MQLLRRTASEGTRSELTGVSTRVLLQVPYEEREQAKALGARWNPEYRAWTAAEEALGRFSRWLPARLVDLGAATGRPVEVAIIGLPAPCWRCGVLSTSLVGLLEVAHPRLQDLVVCDSEVPLAVAARYLPDVPRAMTVRVARYYSKTLACSSLANGCPNCRSLRGNFPLFHEKLPEILADGGSGLETLAVVELPLSHWLCAGGAHFA